jgi:hypothetical protein
MDCDHENSWCTNPVRHPFAEEIIRCADCNRWLERDGDGSLQVKEDQRPDYPPVTKKDLDARARRMFP